MTNVGQVLHMELAGNRSIIPLHDGAKKLLLEAVYIQLPLLPGASGPPRPILEMFPWKAALIKTAGAGDKPIYLIFRTT
jgi:hypothetical protein